MAKGKGRGARDTIYGRRGGGWVPQGHDPMAPAEPVAPKKVDAADDARSAEQHAAVRLFERNNDLVPGTAHFGSSGPEGGTSWEGQARMARARAATGQPLNDVDYDALDRHPTPGSCFTTTASRRTEVVA